MVGRSDVPRVVVFDFGADDLGFLGDRGLVRLVPSSLPLPLDHTHHLGCFQKFCSFRRCSSVAITSGVGVSSTPPAVSLCAFMGVDLVLPDPFKRVVYATPMTFRPRFPWLFSLAPQVRLSRLLGALLSLTLSGISRAFPTLAILRTSSTAPQYLSSHNLLGSLQSFLLFYLQSGPLYSLHTGKKNFMLGVCTCFQHL